VWPCALTVKENRNTRKFMESFHSAQNKKLDGSIMVGSSLSLLTVDLFCTSLCLVMKYTYWCHWNQRNMAARYHGVGEPWFSFFLSFVFFWLVNNRSQWESCVSRVSDSMSWDRWCWTTARISSAARCVAHRSWRALSTELNPTLRFHWTVCCWAAATLVPSTYNSFHVKFIFDGWFLLQSFR